MNGNTGRCGTNTCVDVAPIGDQFLFTSTISPDRGSTLYDRDEVVAFFADVKAGKWDHLLGADAPKVDHSAMVA